MRRGDRNLSRSVQHEAVRAGIWRHALQRPAVRYVGWLASRPWWRFFGEDRPTDGLEGDARLSFVRVLEVADSALALSSYGSKECWP